MGMMAAVTLDIKNRNLEDVWENLQASLVSANGIEPVALSIVFETFDVMIFIWCETPETLNQYIINRLRSIKGVTETTVFFFGEMKEIKHENIDREPGIDGLLFMDIECGKDQHVFNAMIEKVGPEEDSTFTKFVSFCLHSQNLDLLVGFKGTNLYYLEKLFNKIRLINGVIDVNVMMFSRFKTLKEYTLIQERFSWLV
ncbi:hypothetical protein GF325_11330 [Candidatus Bathyarchaeota archaeon]|nr:hypothetical protein [Candidatus Bathyarchaeota archaeon]